MAQNVGRRCRVAFTEVTGVTMLCTWHSYLASWEQELTDSLGIFVHSQTVVVRFSRILLLILSGIDTAHLEKS